MLRCGCEYAYQHAVIMCRMLFGFYSVKILLKFVHSIKLYELHGKYLYFFSYNRVGLGVLYIMYGDFVMMVVDCCIQRL